jgi:hypothetical protein
MVNRTMGDAKQWLNYTFHNRLSTNVDLKMLDEVDKYRDEIKFYMEFCKFRDLLYISVE